MFSNTVLCNRISSPERSTY